MEYKQYYNYLVYENGDIYSLYQNKFLKPDITRDGYVQYALVINNKSQKFRVHRLVGMLFLDLPNNYEELVINHKDGDKLNNHYSNLEWCTTYYNNLHARVIGLNNISLSNTKRWSNPEFKYKVSQSRSKTLINNKTFSGKKNPRFRYCIYDKNNNEYSRHSLAKKLNLSLSYVDRVIRKIAENKNIKNKKFLELGIKVVDIKRSSSTIESVS